MDNLQTPQDATTDSSEQAQSQATTPQANAQTNTQESAPQAQESTQESAPDSSDQSQENTPDQENSGDSQDTQDTQTPQENAQDQGGDQGDTQENSGDQAQDLDPLPQPPLLPQAPDTDPNTKPPELPQSDEQKLEALKQEIAQAIKDNAGVIANTHYTLQGIAELLHISHDLFRFYRYHAQNLQLNSEQLTTLQANLSSVITYINDNLKHISEIYTSNLKLFHTTEALLDEAKTFASTCAQDLSDIKQALKKIGDIEAKLAEINALNNELGSKIALAQAMKQEIEALVPNILNEVKANLLADKEQYERELEAKKDEYITLLEQKLAGLDEKIQDFETSYIQKQRTMEEALQKLKDFIATLDAQKIEFRTSFETYMRKLLESKNAHKAELESFKDEKKGEIESFKGKKQEQLQSFKDQKLAEIEAHTTTQKTTLEAHRENTLNDLRIFSENYLQEVNAFSQAQILELRELYYAIATNAQQLGNKYKSITFTSSQAFTLIDGVRDYFVFVRGGTGGSHSSAAGGISSFGSYVSANGGAGNNGGAGQRGESKAQFVYIEDESVTRVQVTVASGGVVIVSYPSDLEAKIDTSFLSEGDLAILSGSSDEQDQAQWVKDNITTKKQENYYRNLVGLQITLAPITAQNLARILDKKGTPKYASLRHLELELGRAYLDTNKSINAQIAELIKSVAPYTIEATPENLSLEAGQAQELTITTPASDFSASCSSEHITFDKEHRSLQARSAGSASLELRIYDDLHQAQISTRVEVEVSEPTPEPEPETDQESEPAPEVQEPSEQESQGERQ